MPANEDGAAAHAIPGPVAGVALDDDETAGHAELVARGETADLTAGRAFDEHLAAADAGGEQGPGIAADVQPSAAHVAAGADADVAFHDHGAMIEIGADEIETVRGAFDLHRVTGLAGNGEYFADREAAFRRADDELQHLGERDRRQPLGRELREVEPLLRSRVEAERKTAHGSSSRSL